MFKECGILHWYSGSNYTSNILLLLLQIGTLNKLPCESVKLPGRLQACMCAHSHSSMCTYTCTSHTPHTYVYINTTHTSLQVLVKIQETGLNHSKTNLPKGQIKAIHCPNINQHYIIQITSFNWSSSQCSLP